MFTPSFLVCACLMTCVWVQTHTHTHTQLRVNIRPHCLTEVGLGALLSRLPWRALYKTAVIRIAPSELDYKMSTLTSHYWGKMNQRRRRRLVTCQLLSLTKWSE